MSFCMIPSSPIKNAVTEPIIKMNANATSDNSKSGDILATMNIPAVTMVAAWIRADMGVGPSIESGNQTCSGAWADLPIAPMKRRMHIMVIAFQDVVSVILISLDAMRSTREKTS